ncbi:MAG: hypothetical protein F6K42_35905 [Leptolyngbya sp. SIO1D8]|nr:hypothetical protein [Leptolyngbya sp. SIO1D8]
MLYAKEIGDKQHERYWGMDRLLVRMMTRPKGDVDLYNLQDDPYEQHDLADDPQYREILSEFKEQVLQWWEKTSGRTLEM